MFEEGFPIYLSKELHNILGHISMKTYNDSRIGYTPLNCDEECVQLDESIIRFPDRIYFVDDEGVLERLKTKEERLIYHCIFTRSCDGYVREKHLKAILSEDYPEWCMPYILKLSAEYVVEILDLIYISLKNRDNSEFQALCQNNPHLFRCYYSRMISYWNEYYRSNWKKYRDYVGYKLYKECFGFSN